jgi:hypothetical protein
LQGLIYSLICFSIIVSHQWKLIASFTCIIYVPFCWKKNCVWNFGA